MALWAAIVTGTLAGVASAPHCAGMCGPVAAFACRGGERAAPLRYQLGRMVGYAVLGVLAGALGVVVPDRLSTPIAGAVLSWSLAAGLGLSAYRLWRTGSPAPAPLVKLGRPRGAGRPWLRRLPTDPAALGVMTALLPCGSLVAAALLAAGSGSAALGAVTMLSFSLTTALGLLGVAYAARFLGRRPGAARGLALLLALGAVVLVIRPIRALGNGSAECHTPALVSAAP